MKKNSDEIVHTEWYINGYFICVHVRRWTPAMTWNYYYIGSTKYQNCWPNVWNIFFFFSRMFTQNKFNFFRSVWNGNDEKNDQPNCCKIYLRPCYKHYKPTTWMDFVQRNNSVKRKNWNNGIYQCDTWLFISNQNQITYNWFLFGWGVLCQAQTTGGTWLHVK